MVRQDDLRFSEDKDPLAQWIVDEGCAVFSIFFYLNKYKNLKLSIAKIKIYITQMKEAGCFTDDMDVYWEEAFKFFGYPVTYVRKNDPKYRLKKNEFAIACWSYTNESSGKTYKHFCPTQNGICLFDPLGESNCVTQGAVESYRVFKFI